jgi:hypothetical protein
MFLRIIRYKSSSTFGGLMKIISTLLISFTLLTNLAFADISSEIKQLADLAFGYDVVQVKKSKNADDLFKNFAIKEYSEFDQDRFHNKEIEEMSFGDEIDFGFTSVKSATAMGEFAEGQIIDRLEGVDDPQEKVELKAKIYDLKTMWKPSILRLARLGVKFGYDGNGPGYCGVSFVRILILDPATNQVYTVYLSESGPC